ncbi:MAG: phospholipase D-like domain-containing protein [Comamonas sp.]
MHPLTNPLLLPFGHLLFIVFSLLVYAITTHLTHTRRHPSAAFAWVLLLVLVPYVGLPAYLLVGLRKYARPLPSPQPRAPALDAADGNGGHWAMATLDGLRLGSPRANDAVVLHRDGMHALRELERVIASAQHTLDVCTYVLGNDAVAHHLASLLEQAAARGVRVRVLIDAAGSWATSRRFLRRLRAAGVALRRFMPLLHNPMRGRINLRNHRKLVVADGQRLWTGGRNLAQEYFFAARGQPAWIDLTLTIEGQLAHDAHRLFNASWRRHRGQGSRQRADRKASKAGTPPTVGITRAAGLPAATTAPEAAPETARHLAQLVPSGPDLPEDTVLSLLLTGLYQARERVWAVTPYFVPDDSLLRALRLAALRGVEVTLVIPQRSNHWLADIVRKQPLRDFAAAGGRILRVDSMMHAKAILIDDSLGLAGSLNLDARSLFLNFELMVALYSPPDIAALQQWVETLAADARPYAPRAQASLLRDIGEGLVRWLGFQI